MAGGKETPRQKMIGLMYLVLMALLAMNVSKEVINSFITLNNNIDFANQDAIFYNGKVIQDLQGKVYSAEGNEYEKEKAKTSLNKAISVHELSRSAANFFMLEANEMLNEGQEGEWIYDAGDGFYSIVDLVEKEYDKKDDYDIPTRLFVGDNFESINEKGQLLRIKLENYRDSLCILIAGKSNKGNTESFYFQPPSGIKKMSQSDTLWLDGLEDALKTVDAKDRETIKEVYRILTMPEFVVNHGENYPWQAGQFDHAPIAAAVAIFTGIKSKVLQAEKIALNNFNEQSEIPIFKFNTIAPLSFANTGYLNIGDSLNMKIMIAAYDSTATTEIEYWIDDTTMSEINKIVSSKNNVRLGGGIGDHVVNGKIAVETKNGKEWVPFEPFNYSVGSPNAAVSAYDMKVMYVGWKNRVQIAAGGFPPEAITVSGSGCTVTKQGDFYIAEVNNINADPKITVTATREDGTKIQLAQETFRVMPLPKPTVLVGGLGPDKTQMPLPTMKNLLGLGIILDSPLDVQYEVKGFDLTVYVGGAPRTYSSTSAAMTDEMKKALSGQSVGSQMTINNVKVKGPVGIVSIPGASFKAN
ncbi:MAG: hypothetical protein H6598_01810 [Flavobacteriales bacterium]|nr:hypothetical protein [Flavobacteriales bacterium]